MERYHLVIISGVSGSGKSTALKAFEDLGYFCVDNLPAPLITPFVDFLEGLSSGAAATFQNYTKFALLVDFVDENYFPLIEQAVFRLIKAQTEVTLLFFDCQDEVIIRRFQETRRPHPLLAVQGSGSTIREALMRERELLSDFRAAAARVIDTTSFSPHDLRRTVLSFAKGDKASSPELEATILSFGFKYGVPSDVDMILDVRFLANPHFVPELREHTGLEQVVEDFIFQSVEATEFVDRVLDLLQFLVPKYQAEGKSYLTVGIGCTGGQHRSVAIARKIAERLQISGVSAKTRHRDVTRTNS